MNNRSRDRSRNRSRLLWINLGILALLLVSSIGCGTMRQLTSAAFTNAKLSDYVGKGNAGQYIALGNLGADVTEGIPELAAVDVSELGVMLPVTPVGTLRPIWVLCLGEMAQTCKRVPVGAHVRVSGAPVNGGAILPTRLTWDD